MQAEYSILQIADYTVRNYSGMRDIVCSGDIYIMDARLSEVLILIVLILIAGGVLALILRNG